MFLVRIIRRLSPIIFLIAAVYIWYFVSNLPIALQTTKVFSANENIELFTQPQAGRKPILNAIESAQKEILVEVYLLSDKEVIASLGKARQRGIDVKVMLEEHPFGGGNINQKTKKEFSKAGIDVAWTNSDYSLTHEKTIEIDGKTVFVMNQNLTASSFSKNREYDILDSNPKDVSEIRDIFTSDWQRKSYNPKEETSLALCPVNCRKILSALIDRSEKSINIEAETIEDPKIIELISNEAKNETVRLIVPGIKQIPTNSQALQKLKEGSVKVKTLSSPYIHAKLIISDNRMAYLGSINLSAQSMDENREVGMIISNSKIIQSLNQTFEQDWDKATDF